METSDTTRRRRTTGARATADPAEPAAAAALAALLGLAGCLHVPSTEMGREEFLDAVPGESRWTFSTDEEGEREVAVLLGRGETVPFLADPDDRSDAEPALALKVEIDGLIVHSACLKLPERILVKMGYLDSSPWLHARCAGDEASIPLAMEGLALIDAAHTGPSLVSVPFPLEGLAHRVSRVLFRHAAGEPGPVVIGLDLVRLEQPPEIWTDYGKVRTKPPPSHILRPGP